MSRLHTALLAACLLLPSPTAFPQSQPDPLTFQFTYSLIATTANTSALPQAIEAKLAALLRRHNAKTFALWTPAEKPADAPFTGLAPNQVILMVAWPRNAAQAIPALESAIRELQSISSISTRIFLPVYLATGLNVPTTKGFYVHREEHYPHDKAPDAIRLSREAWPTWEPFWRTKVVGLFRESPGPANAVNLNRIAFYPSFQVWSNTRRYADEPASHQRFTARSKLMLPGSGLAIATDRALP